VSKLKAISMTNIRCKKGYELMYSVVLHSIWSYCDSIVIKTLIMKVASALYFQKAYDILKTILKRIA
jgi:hypothetical protein